MRISLPKLTTYQQEVYDWLGDPFESGKIAVLKSVRQSGKTYFCLVELLMMATAHSTVSAIYEPTLNLARNIYKTFAKALANTGLIVSANAQTLEIELRNGSRVMFRSTEQTSRGLTITGIMILDECAYLDNEQIYTILPLVNAHNAPIIIASTPFIEEGYYYDMFKMGYTDNDKVKSFDWARHPEISRFLTEEKKLLYKQTMSRQKYRTEVEGQFLVEDGLLFAGIEKCIGEPKDNRTIYVGIDFATGSDGDYTVLVAINNNGEMVRLYRTNNKTPMEQVDWLFELLMDLNNDYTIRTVLCEQNSIGKVYIDALKKNLIGTQIKITDWTTTNKSKQELVTTLQIALENGRVTLLDNPVLLNELKRYEAEVNARTKTVTYNGKGSNDDTVIATMLAYYAYKKGLGNFSISFA